MALDQEVTLMEAVARAWKAGAGPGKERLTVDVDSFVGEVHGNGKQGACFGYSGRRGYHPLLATRAETGEVLHIRARKGSANTSRGIVRFLDELLARVQQAGAEGEKLLRVDSGFWSNKAMERLQDAGWRYSIGVRMQPHVKAAIAEIPQSGWSTIDGASHRSVVKSSSRQLDRDAGTAEVDQRDQRRR